MSRPGYTLVIAEDVERTRTGLEDFFKREATGFTVVATFDNGRDTYKYISQHQVDVLLCDIRLPLLSGVDIARDLHARNSRTRIVFVSAYRDFDYAVSALDFGVESYLTKPVRERELLDAFERIRSQLDQERGGQIHQNPLETLSYPERVVGVAKRYVENISENVTLGEVADRVSMSPSHFSRYFHEHMGMTFAQFRRSVRMQRAAWLLRSLERTIGDVSEEMGYDNPKNFSRAFRKYFGMTPREFRNREKS